MNARSIGRAVVWVWLVSLIGLVRPVGAGEPAKPQPTPPGPATSAPAAPHPATPEAAEADKERIIREQSIYVPYEKLRKVFEKEGRGVFLPYEKFREMWEAAQSKKEAPQPKAPIAAAITESDSEASVSKEVVQVKTVLKLDVIQEGWNEIPLRLADAAITEATLGGQPARIVSSANEGYKLLVEKKGKSPERMELVLRFAKSISRSPGQNSVAFEAPQAAVSRWQVRIPEAGVKVNLSPQLAVTEGPEKAEPEKTEKPAPAKTNETVVRAYVGAAPSVRIEWTPKAEGATGLEALASVQAEQQVTLGEGVMRTRTQLAYTISRAELRQLAIEVPADQKVVNVFDANVRLWSVEVAGAMQKITVQLFEPAKGTQNVIVELEKFASKPAEGKPEAKPEQIQVPVVRALAVGRQQGVVVVRIAEGLHAEMLRSGGLLQVDAAELPASMGRAPWAFAYRYATVPFDLQLDVQKLQPRIVVDSLVEAELQPERLGLDVLAIYDIQRAGVFRLEYDVPAGFEVRQVRGRAAAGAAEVQVDSQHTEGKEKPRLVVNLARKAMGRVGLAIELSRELHEADLLTPTGTAAVLPLLLPQVAAGSVERAAGRLVVHVPESLQVHPSKPEGLRIITYQEAMASIEPARQGKSSDARPVVAYAFTQDPASITLVAERRKPHVTVRQLLAAQIDSGAVKYRATFFYDVRYSGVKSLRIDVPKDLAGQIRVETPNIRKEPIEPAPAKLTENGVAWRLVGERDFLGEGKIELSWEPKIEKLVLGAGIPIVVPRLKPMDVDREWGQIVLAKAETIDLRDDPDKQHGLQPIDPQHDLMPGVPVTNAARAFEFHEDWALTVDAVRYHLEQIKNTSIERALLRMVVTRADQVAVQALYRMRSAEQRLEVQLPANVAVDTQPRIDGKSVALETEGGHYFVPLVGAKTENSFLLELRYSVPWGGRLEYPDFPGQPAMQQVYLAVYLPEERVLLNKRGPWTDEFDWHAGDWNRWRPRPHRSDQDLLRWVAASAPLGETFPTDGRMYLFSTIRPAAPAEGALRLKTIKEDWLHGVLFVAVLLAGAALVPVRFSRKVVALAGLVTVLVFCGVFWPFLAWQVLNNILAASLLVVLAMWMASWVVAEARNGAFQTWRTRPATQTPSAPADEPAKEPAAAETATQASTPPTPAAGEGGPNHA